MKDEDRYYPDGSLKRNRFGDVVITAPDPYKFKNFLKFNPLLWKGEWHVRDGWHDKTRYLCKDKETAEAVCKFVREHGTIKLVILTGNNSGPAPDGTVLELREGIEYAGRYQDVNVAYRDNGEEVHVRSGQYKIFLAFDEPFPFEVQEGPSEIV